MPRLFVFSLAAPYQFDGNSNGCTDFMRKIQSMETLDDLQFRCKQCQKLLGMQVIRSGEFEIKCVRCGTVNEIFRGICEQVIVTDPDGKILYVNEMLEEITGYTVQEAVGKKPSLWGGQMPEKFYRDLWHTLRDKKESVSAVVTNKRKNGSVYKVLLTISPIFDTKRKIVMYIGMERVLKK